ncbi:hypothetical protein BUALT_Bualt13G0051500 [Buddleja alternifolia]|uniref:Uncharacterized protein n=1 Tax=Buddleja alternifolia TaxID=168488 RepID=A0AAV6WKL2_9LAMI|nr:hypothetical protein BUALT_Bualt13G0051500 [Buddleja alternifolia]
MSRRHVAVESPPLPATRSRQLLTTSSNRRFDTKSDGTSGGSSRVGETAGECAAVWCCCPCAMVDLVILAVYRLPIGIWRKKKRKNVLRDKRKMISSMENEDRRKMNSLTEEEEYRSRNEPVEWNSEILVGFNGAGFWRSGYDEASEPPPTQSPSPFSSTPPVKRPDLKRQRPPLTNLKSSESTAGHHREPLVSRSSRDSTTTSTSYCVFHPEIPTPPHQNAVVAATPPQQRHITATKQIRPDLAAGC